jgi:putative transposase
MRYAFVEEQRASHSVRRMCTLLDVSAAGYYEWRGRTPSRRSVANEGLRAAIVRVHEESRGTYGRIRIHKELVESGLHVGSGRVGRLMKSAEIAGISPRRFRKTTDSDHALPVAQNLLARSFDSAVIGEKNRIWAGDITYVATREGWLYLAVVLDLFSRRVVGWSMKFTMDRGLVIDALESALRNRQPTAGMLFHSDRGSQYASAEFRAILEANSIQQSMSGKGECWDNAVVESFFGTMKSELGDRVWESRAAARDAIFDYIETWYNRKRRHSTLGYVSPETYESLLPIAA